MSSSTSPSLAGAASLGLLVRSVRVEAGGLLERLPTEGALAWVRNGEGLVGWGVAARIEVAGAERFSRAQRWWQEWCRNAQIEDAVGVPGSGPVAFASFAFDPEPGTSTVVVPRVVLGRRGDDTWMTVVGDSPEALQAVAEPTVPGPVEWRDGSRPRADWQGAVDEAIARINRGELDKVVLARDIVGVASEPIDIRYVLRRLAQDYPSCWTFSVDGLVGATPELLVRRTGDDVTSRVLAGTVKRRGEAAVDEGLARALLGSDKDLEEHKYAVHSVARALATHCTDLHVPSRPHILRLANVQHLATDVTGRLADSAPVLALAASLHPTAAVCGTPTERALALIRETEGMDRGRYSGPVGWFDAHGDGEFGIALRCAEFDGARVRAFAGCGIVAGSDPDSELAESAAKLLPIRSALSLD
jgi:menaquinone-specific isochorismate synthase